MHFLMKLLSVSVFAGVALIGAASAQVKLDGYFIAKEACPAFQSFHKQTNPGNVSVERMRAYELLGKNKAEASHYFLRFNGVEPRDRWVAVQCGVHVVPVSGQNAGDTGSVEFVRPAITGPSQNADFVLAASWQPAFCQGNQEIKECASQTEVRFDADNFALHGLWPQPRGNFWCGVTQDQKKLAENRETRGELPVIELSSKTRVELNRVMPGTQSYLDRYEWIKHGTCYSETPEEYYVESIDLMDQLNGSVVRDLFAGNIGGSLTAGQIRSAFDAAFGEGAGERVEVRCRSGMVNELFIHLRGQIETDTSFSDLLLAADPVRVGCQQGEIDAVGF